MDTPATPLSSAAGDSGLTSGMLVGGGRYQLQRVLGMGGMGEVWLALDSRLREQVALKFLPSNIQGDAEALEDMRRETLKSHRLTHPNIIRIHDLYESPDELPFISMEYISGQNLHQLCHEQPQSVYAWAYLRPIIQQLCEALQYAHDEGVIHRDLKPANMMLDARGRLKLADFGIAAMVSESAQRELGPQANCGTLTHMSPQQLQGHLPSVTDDIYSLGATLYELLSSKPPFHKGDLLPQVLDQPAPPLRNRLWELAIENPIPDDVVSLIMACLSKDPTQRPQSAADISAWLGLTTRNNTAPLISPTLAPTPEAEKEIAAAPSQRRSPVLISLLLLVGLGGAGWLGWENYLRPTPLKNGWNEQARWQVVSESPLPGNDWSVPWLIKDDSGLHAACFNFETSGDDALRTVTANLRWLDSPEGLTWQPGKASFTNGIVQWVYESEYSTSHAIGRRDGDGWTAGGGRGHMVYGPYHRFPEGDYIAAFRLQTEKVTPRDQGLGYVDVAHNSGHSIIIQGLKRGDFREANVYQSIELPFHCRSDQSLEFRTHLDSSGRLKQDNVTLTRQAGPHKAIDRITLGSISRHQGQWYYVYQGIDENQKTICVATSTDGQNFEPISANPILRTSENGWDKAHVGAPVLYQENGTWYLFYTGYDGTQTALGVAYGTTLANLQKHSRPVLQPSGDGNRWDGSGFGRISQILKEKDVYYAAAEAWTGSPDQTTWRVGLIQSTNLLEWTAAPTPVTDSIDFHASSPSLLSLNGKPVLYVQQTKGTNSTLCRLELAPMR